LTTIKNASVRYYELETVWDLDANNNGWIDSTEIIDLNGDGLIDALDASARVQVDWNKGWTCHDIPASWNW